MAGAGRPGRRVWLAAGALWLAGTAGAAAPALTFGGWMDVYADAKVVEAAPELFNSLSFGMYGITRDGSLRRSNRVPDRTALMAWAHAHGIKIFATLGGEKDALPDGFTGKALERTLAETVAVCATLGFDGVDVDIEEIPGTCRDAYTLYIAGLLDALKAMSPPRRLSVTVQSFTNEKDEAASFLDYRVLGRLADEVRVMHYNCPWGEPGPLMPRADFAAGVAYARSKIPAEKYVAAVPWYGTDWNVPDNSSEDILARMTEKADGIPSLSEVVARFGGAPRWREPEGELSYSYTRDGQYHEAWVADPRTFAWMADVVRKAGAAGMYAYQLEYADLGFLAVLRRTLRE